MENSGVGSEARVAAGEVQERGSSSSEAPNCFCAPASLDAPALGVLELAGVR